MSLVIVGSIALDSIKTSIDQVEDVLGGSAIYASIAGKNFTDVSIIGVVGEDFPQSYIDLLRDRDIDIEGVVQVPGKTFRWKGEYHNFNQATTLETHLNVFAEFEPVLTQKCKSNSVTFLANIHPSLQLQVLDQIECSDFVAMDTMNLWIDLTKPELTKVIKRVDLIFINEDEIKMYAEKSNVFEAIESVLALGVKYVVVKRGEYGAVVATTEELFFMPVYPVRKVVDPTGAGDSFAGGFAGYLASVKKYDFETMKLATLYGTITAANNIQSFSVENLQQLSREEIESMSEELKQWIKI